MTRRECAILSAYTGYMLVPAGHFGEIHQIIQEALGRPVWTHEMASEKLQEQIREALRPQVQEIMERAYWEDSKE